jgi:bifunctional enzyme CysN/CysC
MAHVSDLIEKDIDAYLEAHQHKSLLRFITCGSVDDGKSTLIGRLLYDSKMIFEDQLAALEADSKRVGTQGQNIDFALLVDGLAAEREQGHRRRLPLLLHRQAQVHRRRYAGT